MFVPRNEYEETILLLLISEAMAVRDAVLSQSPEFKEARIHAFENATAVYDLLTVVVVRWSQVELLYEVEKTFFVLFYNRCIVKLVDIIHSLLTVFRKSDEILSRGGAYMDAVRIMPDKYGEIYARV